MSERSWRGTWWVTDDPEAVVPGTLYCAEDGRLRLELVGGFDDEIRIPLPGGNGYAVSMQSRGFPLIHGVSGHEAFTLIDTLATYTGGTGIFKGEIVTQDLQPNRALRGIHLTSLDEPVFDRGHLQLERLLDWTAGLPSICDSASARRKTPSVTGRLVRIGSSLCPYATVI